MKDTTWKIGFSLIIILVALGSFESPVRDWLDQRGFPLLGPEIKSAGEVKEEESCGCGSYSVCAATKKVLEQKCADLTENCGDSCVGTNENAKSCKKQKDKLFEERKWYQTNCVDDGCGQPLEPCCDVEPVGACCRIYDDGTYECDSDLTENNCSSMAEEENAIDHRWHEGLTCQEVNCGIGACCITIPPQGASGEACVVSLTQCYEDITNLRCQIIADEISRREDTIAVPLWHYDKTCAEAGCVREQCGPIRARSEEQCLRLLCPFNPDTCWAIFIPDEQGCVCCGPV